MADLSTNYLGINLKNPYVVGACSWTANLDRIKKMEEAGAAAIVIQSLFEEQIQLERFKLDEELELYDDWHAEMTNIFPDHLDHAGPQEHLMWVEKTKQETSLPVIASLNCVNHDSWIDYAKQLEQTGCDALELNFFSIPINNDKSGSDVENEQLQVIKDVKAAVKIPVSVKLSAFYTSPVEIMTKMDEAGVDGMVLFNRFFHPSFDIEKETSEFPFNLSTSNDHRLPLRFVGLMYDRVKASVCGSNGIHTAEDAVEMLLAGANAFQAVSTMYLNGSKVIADIILGISEWMDRKGYESLDQFRGKLSEQNHEDRFAYRRAQYVKMLLRSDEFLRRPNLI